MAKKSMIRRATGAQVTTQAPQRQATASTNKIHEVPLPVNDDKGIYSGSKNCPNVWPFCNV